MTKVLKEEKDELLSGSIWFYIFANQVKNEPCK